MPFQIVRNDITKMQVDAIVNTANPYPVYGDGVDTAVYAAAGPELMEAREKIGEIEPGSSVVTPGFGLPVRFIIHTVGTFWEDGKSGEEDVIRSCYRSVFELAFSNQIESLAIPLLASGSYGFPKGIALRIALSEIESFLSDHDLTVYLVVFDEKSYSLSAELYGDIESYISDHYVEQKAEDEYPHMGVTMAGRPAPTAMPAMTVPQAMSAPFAMAGKSDMLSAEFAEEAPSESTAPSEKKRKEQKNGLRRLFASKTCEESAEDTGAADEGIMLGAKLDASYASGYGNPEPAICMAAARPQRSLEEVVANLDKTFMELVFSFADERGFTDVEVQKRANLDRKAFSKLKCGTTKNPSKSTALALAIALELNLDETRDLLSRAGLALSPCSKQDVIVRYFIEREAYDVYAVNLALFEHGEPLLGTQS